MTASNKAVDASITRVLALDCMENESGGDEAKIFLRIPETLKQAWVDACAGRKITQNEAGEALIRLVVAQEDTVQAQMFGQIGAKEGKVVCVAPKKARVGHAGKPGDLAKKRPRQRGHDANPRAAQSPPR
jgi:hypothetical protein